MNITEFQPHPGSPYRTILSKAILELQEEGVLAGLQYKWFEAGAPDCDHDDLQVHLNLYNLGELRADCRRVVTNKVSNSNFLGPIILVVAVGLVLAALIAMCELCFYSRAKSRQELVRMPRTFLFSVNI